ncbi:MAG: helix-turn-helix domain-containing protein [Pseudorhodoplanes sp.]|nr:helix-turn-helix domain-containing protein [Pseudorhodoplanes sp.]
MVSERKDASTSAPVLPRGVRRALDAMQAAAGREIGLSELAKTAGMSGRALQRQFRNFLGKTPVEALQDIRYERARRQLLQGAPGLKVMDVAARCGLTHFGRFSLEYRRRYGETPSQTLKRQATFIEMLAGERHPVMSGQERPTLAIGAIESEPAQGEVAREIADELAAALARTGVGLSNRTEYARYQLAGGLKGAGAQTRLMLRLIDRETGRHLWAHRTELPLQGPGAFDDHMATRIAAALQPSLRGAEIERARRRPDRDVTAQDLALRALPCVLSLDPESNARALDMLDRAMERDPDNALALALAAWAHGQRVIYHFTSDPHDDRLRSAAFAKRALALPADAVVLSIIGNALTLLHDIDTAEQVVGRALAIDGGSAWAWSRSGWIDAYKGKSDSAIERLTIALELAPDDPLAFNAMVGIGCAHFGAGRYGEAARWQARALAEHSSSAWIHRTLCPAHLIAGAKDQAKRSLDALREKYPDLTVSKVPEGLPPLPRDFRDRIMDALAQAGLPA